MMNKILKALLGLILLAVFIAPPQAGRAQNQPPSPETIAAFLNQHPLVQPTGGRVLQVFYQGEALVINLSQEALPDGIYNEELFTRLQQDLDLAFNINARFMTTFKVEGLVLEAWGKPEPDFPLPPQTFSFRSPQGDAPLSGISVALSPGHGLFWSEYWGQWAYQRAEFFGIREDLVNAEIMRYVTAALLNQGATVISLREMDPNARIGVTGLPAWHEAARQYLIYEGAPSWVWNSSNTNYNRDIRARPYAANYYGADILISLHNNGWNGTLTGTETYYDTNNHPGSPGLAAAVHNRIINMIRSEYDPDWYNRGIKPSDSNYGEINYAQMPAILIELAFMDTQFPDNAYLQDEAFKQLAARAITFGICDFLGVTCTDTPITMPIIQETPVLSPPYGSGPCDSGWYAHPNIRGQNAYLALNVSDTFESEHFALWQPSLPMSGVYHVEAFIPNHGPIDWGCPDLTITSDTLHASYQITHAQGTSIAIANQGPIADKWVDLGNHYFNAGNDGFVILTDVTGETDQTTMISVSAMRFTLVGNAMSPLYNRNWITEDSLTRGLDTTVEEIRNFLGWQNSCLADPIVDADGLVMDIPSLLYQTAVNRSINPQILLAIMEKEQNALTLCPDADALASLMGLDPPNTARQQMDNAALLLRQALDELTATGTTPNGWSTGTAKTTEDGVEIIPANDTITVLLDFEPYAGEGWGGSLPGEDGLHGIYMAWEWFGFEAPLRSLQPTVLYFPIFWNQSGD
jgi:N-acetylmuramoyl-L-alanine amidase